VSLEVVSLQEAHLEDAARLACACYRALRARVPCHVDSHLQQSCPRVS
jgi:hypothetical protein